MIVCNNISKNYGSQKALDQISFTAKKGKILGLLGPNGAGKSTLMKIMTGFIEANAGTVTVCGHTMGVNKPQLQHLIGYLPEHNPLYLEMYVKQYLEYVAGLYNVAVAEVEDVIDRVGLSPERHKKIKQLSKGYRQRVGLASALLHHPEVLILDEPTTGLDPNQIIEVRELIKSVAQDKTVILSTHIMQEVTSICDEVLIINNGKIVANDSVDNVLHLFGAKQQLVLEFLEEVDLDVLKSAHASIAQVQTLGKNKYELHLDTDVDVRADISNYAVSQGWTILMMQIHDSDLENVFAQLTTH